MQLLDLLFPPRCAGCGRGGQWFCQKCQAEIMPVPRGLVVSEPLGLLLAETYRRQARLRLPPDALLPVPLHARRLAERVYSEVPPPEGGRLLQRRTAVGHFLAPEQNVDGSIVVTI